MVSKLSELDFQRLQENLLELKTSNYTLQEEARKSKHGLGEAQARIKVLESTLEKANKTIDKSKKAAEVQQLLKENRFFKEKLEFQEEQFRHQNQTLMHELNQLVTKNEALEESLNKQSSKEVETLQQSVETLTQTNKDLAVKNETLRRKLNDNIDDNGNSSSEKTSVDGSVDQPEVQLESIQAENGILRDQISQLKEKLAEGTQNQDAMEAELVSVSEKLKRKQETLVDLQTERENLLEQHRGTIETMKNDFSQEVAQVKEERDRLQTQLNHVQDSIRDLKELSESTQQEHQQTVDDLQMKLKENPPEKIKELEAANIVLHNQLESVKDQLEKKVDETARLTSDLQNSETMLKQLHHQNEANDDAMAKMEAEVEALRTTCDSRKVLIDEMALQIQKKSEDFMAMEKDTAARIEEMTSAHEGEIKSYSLQMENKDKEVKTLSAEKKAALAAMTARIAELESTLLEKDKKSLETEGQLEQLKTKVEATEKELESLKLNFDEERTNLTEELTQQHQAKVKELETQLELANVQKVEFEEKNLKLEQDLRDAAEERKITEKKGKAQLKDVTRQLTNERRKNEKLQEKMSELSIDTESNYSDQVKDVEQDRSSISSWSLMSGNNDRDRTSTPSSQISPEIRSPEVPVEPLVQDPGNVIAAAVIPGTRRETVDSVRRQNGGVENEGVQGKGDPREDYKAEHHDTEVLMNRVADLQQEKWRLEEKLQMLEQSGAAMAEEIFRKNNLIQFYCMDAGRGPGPVKPGGAAGQSSVTAPSGGSGDKVKHFMEKLVHHDQHDIHTKEIQRMQQMLEETLTKNMFLQQNMDTLSQEVVRLSKRIPVSDD